MEPLGTATTDLVRTIARVVIAAPFVGYGLMVMVSGGAYVTSLF